MPSFPSLVSHTLFGTDLIGLFLRTATFVGFGCSAEVLGQVLDTSLWTVSFGTGRVDSDELTVGNTSADVEDIFDLIQLSAAAR